MGTELKVRLGKQKIDEIQLPNLYFVSVNQWLEVIEDIAFMSWLKMFTWTKQEDVFYPKEEYDSQDSVSYSMSAIAKKLGVANETLQNKILIPLWNVGLIDIIERNNKEKIGSKHLTIIVYKYPKNEIERSFKQLEVIRDYKSDYTQNARVFHNSYKEKLYKDNKSETDLHIQNVLIKHKKRLVNDQIDVKVILDIWESEKKKVDCISENEFSKMLDSALSYTKDRIGSKGTVKGFFLSVLRSYKEKKK